MGELGFKVKSSNSRTTILYSFLNHLQTARDFWIKPHNPESRKVDTKSTLSRKKESHLLLSALIILAFDYVNQE